MFGRVSWGQVTRWLDPALLTVVTTAPDTAETRSQRRKKPSDHSMSIVEVIDKNNGRRKSIIV